ncbi:MULTISPECIES: MarR family winged helix-turn-helix transcriptional regulator [unclassified Rathayibacter]|uniref:MarR family winged helix-turn-helix transcriptional regulator n=1 Tax=unclassified Rathayibacter TaxID=2609250 RepID=UPI00188A6764|nr:MULTISPECIES: MarR family transcriptional regulator [unclassified Rathayibacter]MBF4463192.1 MarR family transcriptional regulator [Rathayibacter sp. VKM Ac-2879]MBF4504571.1 MarR family transcriptional regulator [Rathayibacter sp. VKM Ac-2878]
MKQFAGDAVDAIRDGWSALRPTLDTSAIDVVGRLIRASALVVRATEERLLEHGLTRGEFDVLAALRRSEAPLSPTSLRTVALASAPAITKRLHALRGRGLIVRSANPSDGRGALISLSGTGVELIDRAFPEVLSVEQALLAGASRRQLEEATRALRIVLASIESAAER